MSQLGSLSPNGRSEKVEIVVPAGGGSDGTPQQDGITSPDPAPLGGAANTTNDVPTMAADLTQPPPVKVQAALNARAYHRLNLDQETNLWTEYVTQADALDKDLVKTLTADLDTLLIFVSYLSIFLVSRLMVCVKGWSFLRYQYGLRHRVVQRP